MADIPDEAVELAARASFVRQSDFDSLSDVGKNIELHQARRMLAAALPVLNTAKDSETASWIDVVIARLTAVGGPDVAGAVATLRSLAASLRGEQP